MERSDFEKTATRVSAVSIIINIALATFKFAAGIIGHSQVMISDAVHSSSDVAGSLIVLTGVKLSEKASDADHPYGHERFENVASIILSGILAAAGIGIGKEAVSSILSGSYKELISPGILVITAAALSIIVKEAMFWYTKINAKKIRSDALNAEAWHHRSDALSSVGALIGIICSRLGIPVAEPIASILICLLILKAALDVFMESIDKMTDHACDKATEDAIIRCAKKQEGVLEIDLIRTREFGRRIYVDLEFSADGDLTLYEAHDIAQKVHDRIEKEFPAVKHIMVHVNPKI